MYNQVSVNNEPIYFQRNTLHEKTKEFITKFLVDKYNVLPTGLNINVNLIGDHFKISVEHEKKSDCSQTQEYFTDSEEKLTKELHTLLAQHFGYRDFEPIFFSASTQYTVNPYKEKTAFQQVLKDAFEKHVGVTLHVDQMTEFLSSKLSFDFDQKSPEEKHDIMQRLQSKVVFDEIMDDFEDTIGMRQFLIAKSDNPIQLQTDNSSMYAQIRTELMKIPDNQFSDKEKILSSLRVENIGSLLTVKINCTSVPDGKTIKDVLQQLSLKEEGLHDHEFNDIKTHCSIEKIRSIIQQALHDEYTDKYAFVVNIDPDLSNIKIDVTYEGSANVLLLEKLKIQIDHMREGILAAMQKEFGSHDYGMKHKNTYLLSERLWE